MYGKLIIALIFSISVFSCQKAELLNAEKVKVVPGARRALPHFSYSVNIKIEKELLFKTIVLENGEKVIDFNVSGADRQEQSNKQLYQKGEYSLSFKKNESSSETDEIVLVLLQNKKGKEIKLSGKALFSESTRR